MSLFSRLLSDDASGGQPPNAGPPPAPEAKVVLSPPGSVLDAAPHVGAGTVASLREDLQRAYEINRSSEAFAPLAVELIAKSAGVKSAALLGYEPRRGRLPVLGSVGLDAAALHTLGGDGPSAWDIPLRAVQARRINVIEAAHENPFVPRSLVALSPRRLTIAVLPFFHANAPVGAVVLFSPTPRGFPDGLLKALSQGLRGCASGLSEVSAAAAARAPAGEVPGGEPPLLRGIAALKAELARLTADLGASEQQRAMEATERVTAQSFLTAARERGVQVERELAEERAALEASRAAEDRLRQRLHEAEGELANRDSARSEVAAMAAAQAEELDRARAEIERTRVLAQEAAAAEVRHQEELAGLRARLAAAEEEKARVAASLEEQGRLLESVEAGVSAAMEVSAEAADQEEEDSVLVIERAVAPEGAASDAVTDLVAAVESGVGGEIIVLDDGEVAAAATQYLAKIGRRAGTLPASPTAAAALAARAVCAALNLAAPDAMALVRNLRGASGGAHLPLAGYVTFAEAGKGFWLGAVDFALLPAGQADLAVRLNRLAPRVRRVIGMSNDIDIMSDVRQQLAAVGISTAVVLDGRQAIDLVPTIRPNAAILHLSPSCTDVFRAIAGLRAADVSREIPLLFLLDAVPQPREAAFLAAGLRTLTTRGELRPEALGEMLAAAFAG